MQKSFEDNGRSGRVIKKGTPELVAKICSFLDKDFRSLPLTIAKLFDAAESTVHKIFYDDLKIAKLDNLFQVGLESWSWT